MRKMSIKKYRHREKLLQIRVYCAKITEKKRKKEIQNESLIDRFYG